MGAEGTKGRTVTLHVKIDDGNVEDVLRLGEFEAANAHFTNQEVEAKLADLSERARGLDPDEHSGTIASHLRAHFRLARTVLSLHDAAFAVPGALVLVNGTYGLASEALQFDGTVRMKATISEAAGGGVKSVLLKAIDPLFKRGNAGALIPIKIHGSRNDPKIGLDFGRTLKRQ